MWFPSTITFTAHHSSHSQRKPTEAPLAMGIDGTGKAAATHHGNRALGVGTMDGRGHGIIVMLPCRRTGLKVLPEGDHIKAIFAP